MSIKITFSQWLQDSGNTDADSIAWPQRTTGVTCDFAVSPVLSLVLHFGCVCIILVNSYRKRTMP